MNFLKFLMLLAITLWLGGIVFFTAIEAPTILHTISDRALGGAIISHSLFELHNFGIACGVIFLGCSMIYSRRSQGKIKAAAPEHLLVLLMLGCTLISQRAVLPAITLLRYAPANVGTAAEFARLHAWSVSLEAATLLFGLIVLYFLARRLS
jgi:hypothetical protein